MSGTAKVIGIALGNILFLYVRQQEGQIPIIIASELKKRRNRTTIKITNMSWQYCVTIAPIFRSNNFIQNSKAHQQNIIVKPSTNLLLFTLDK